MICIGPTVVRCKANEHKSNVKDVVATDDSLESGAPGVVGGCLFQWQLVPRNKEWI